jgi:hypothetical protein
MDQDGPGMIQMFEKLLKELIMTKDATDKVDGT